VDYEMAMTLTPEEIRHLERLAVTGERGRIIGGLTSHSIMKRLVEARYVTDHAVSMDAVLYVITDLGRKALEDAKR
jgi:hypothetical protein